MCQSKAQGGKRCDSKMHVTSSCEVSKDSIPAGDLSGDSSDAILIPSASPLTVGTPLPNEVFPVERAINLLTGFLNTDLSQHYIVSRSGKINKGNAGQVLERHIGLENNSKREPDGGTWELKSHKLMLRRAGIVPTETIALGMINEDDFYDVDANGEMIPVEFEDSVVYHKIRNVLYCGILKEKASEKAIFHSLNHFEFSTAKHEDFYKGVKDDYDLIRDRYLNNESITSRYGKLMQARTKGAGHGSTTRAFYWRTATVKTILELCKEGNNN